MLDLIDKVFNELNLAWCDGSSKEIIKSKQLKELLLIFPNLSKIFKDGQKNDDFEFRRTIKHLFRVLMVYSMFRNGKFKHETLSDAALKEIQNKIKKLDDINQKYLPLILMYHDIGRFYDKNDHPNASFLLISSNKLLDIYGLSEIEKLLINKIIQYHLFFATIYTGESTFYGIYSLINDREFVDLILNEDDNMIDLFVDLLEIFTFIDVFGYPYAQIYDHYIEYYGEINLKLKNLLKRLPDREKLLALALQYSYEWLDFRIAGALRIFQFVKTKPYLTENFYFNKIKESINHLLIENEEQLNWNSIKKKYLTHTSKIQVKYGLPLLMILAFGNFNRGKLRKNQEISPVLVYFWINLSKQIQKRSKDKNALWNLYFKGLPFWSELNRNFAQKLTSDVLKSLLERARDEFIEEKKEYNLYLDFNPLIE
ncbi:MAG: hypothetical protein EAX96_04220 [Candidatus Lokiarchaeota archaeon]|nr:hypothetical protein [Candidatus Lokiarchaeota archaeon]